MFRVVQEALTNAIRHLRSPVRMEITLDWGDAEAVVTVRDDGGRGTLRRADPHGTGLIGLAERVRRAGGTLDVCRGTGWLVRARLPTGSTP